MNPFRWQVLARKTRGWTAGLLLAFALAGSARSESPPVAAPGEAGAAQPCALLGFAPLVGGQSLRSRAMASRSVSSFLAKQKRTTRWSKPSP